MNPTALFPRRLFYGWVVVVAAFLLMFTGFGVAYSFPAYFDPFTQEFGVDRATVSFVFSLFGLLYFGLGALTGVLTDRFGPRLLSVIAAVCYFAGLYLASRAGEMWQVYVTFSLFVGLAVSATYVPSISTVQRWFVKRRALASGLAVSGIGVGTFVGPVLSAWAIGTVGWRFAYLVTGIIAAVLTLVAGWLLLRSPLVVGRGPDGEPVGPLTSAVRGRLNPADRTVREAIRTREFIALYIVIGFACLPVFFGFVHLAQYAADRGLPPAVAASIALGGIGIGSALGRLFLSPVADRVGRRPTYAMSIAAIAVLMVIWPFLPADQIPLLAVYAFFFGTAYGGFVALCPAMMADYFGTSYVSGTIGVFYTGAGIGAFIGPLLGGAVYDRYGSYTPTVIVGAVLAFIGTGIVLWLRDPARVKAQWASAVSAPAPPILSPTLAPDRPAAVAEPAPDWAAWLVASHSHELALAGEIAALARQTADPALAEVLEIAEGRTRDRAFLLKRARAGETAPETAAPADRPLAPAPTIARVDAWLGQLDRYHQAVPAAPNPDATALVERLRESERETVGLLSDERERLLAEAVRQAVRIRPGAPARVVGDGEAYWKMLTPAATGRAPVARVVQQPGSAIRVAPDGGSCLLFGEQGTGLVRVGAGRDLPLVAGRAVEVGEDRVAEVFAPEGLPLVYLLIGATSMPWSAPGRSEALEKVAGEPLDALAILD